MASRLRWRRVSAPILGPRAGAAPGLLRHRVLPGGDLSVPSLTAAARERACDLCSAAIAIGDTGRRRRRRGGPAARVAAALAPADIGCVNKRGGGSPAACCYTRIVASCVRWLPGCTTLVSKTLADSAHASAMILPVQSSVGVLRHKHAYRSARKFLQRAFSRSISSCVFTARSDTFPRRKVSRARIAVWTLRHDSKWSPDERQAPSRP